MTRIVVAMFAVGSAVAAILALSQKQFANSKFEFGVYRTYSGTIEERPLLSIDSGGTRYLLVAPGKWGADELARGKHGRRVDLRASLIERGGVSMLEIEPGSIVDRGEGKAAPWENRGPADVTGEIVDTKCFLGVMNPGEGRVHRQCAARCLSGGVPAAIAQGDTVVFVSGIASRDLVPFAGDRVTVSGGVFSSGPIRVLITDLARLRRE
ncbi:MAG: hypothetical protein SFV18_00535 [Bryobacteraceae bacterium]|nr:hypothetical protein [Bryobacteraceae bacterium]